jgi:hypothetical protein
MAGWMSDKFKMLGIDLTGFNSMRSDLSAAAGIFGFDQRTVFEHEFP